MSIEFGTLDSELSHVLVRSYRPEVVQAAITSRVLVVGADGTVTSWIRPDAE